MNYVLLYIVSYIGEEHILNRTRKIIMEIIMEIVV